MKLSTWLSGGMIVTAVCISMVAMGQHGDATKLVGTKKCAMCHKKDAKGNQYARWQEGPHSKTFEILGTEEAKAVGAKLGIDDPQTSTACLKCHSTAYFFTEELQSDAVAVEDGVSCESCHGPGADYKSKSVMESREDSIANGMIADSKTRCVLCHNESSATWNPERYTLSDGSKVGFDVEQAYEKIQHERPAE